MQVSAPASSANLGPGFDTLGLALDLPFRLTDAQSVPVGFHPAESTHPAAAAYVVAGGDPQCPLSWQSPIPPGRGLGFSGAARAAGAYLAHRHSGADAETSRRGAMRVATMLEGHPDNAAASIYGGFTVAVGETVVSLPVPADPAVFVWSPATSTATNASRRALPEQVSLDDAAFSAARAALWVASVASGDLSALRIACEDRLHQPTRLAARADSAAVLAALLAQDSVLAAWLSGSGPTVAGLIASRDEADGVVAAIPESGDVRLLSVDRSGITET